MEKQNPTDPKIKKINFKSSKLKLVHTISDLEDPFEFEKHVNEEEMTFQIMIFSDISYDHFSFFPIGKIAQIKMGEIVVWEDSFRKYIDIRSITKQKKDRFFLIEGSLIDFSESLE